MRNIIFIRIDDRLLHGEVIVDWIPTTKCNKVIIIDDKTGGDVFLRRVLELTAPKNVKLEIYNIEQSIEVLSSASVSKERIMILVKSPIVLIKLLERGIAFSEVNVGGMGLMENRQPFFKNISCTEEELRAFFDLIYTYKVDVFYQLVPEQRRFDLETILSNSTISFGREI